MPFDIPAGRIGAGSALRLFGDRSGFNLGGSKDWHKVKLLELITIAGSLKETPTCCVTSVQHIQDVVP